mmetsp:Transcript_97219/g.182815  ORF Transcript_97219/g.182815 Transcript_97219/m.182815 type:complete len:1094 (-) Transcript_97219:84-3365(-)
MQKCGGRILTEEEVHANVLRALAIEEKRDIRRLGRDWEEAKVEPLDNVCSEDGVPLEAMEAIVKKVKTSATNSLSQTEWLAMEAAMPPEERLTHRNLQTWMGVRAKEHGVAAPKEDEEDDDDPEILAILGDVQEGDVEGGDSGDDEEAANVAKKRAKEEEEDKEEVGKIEKQKNWSSVNLVYKESKLSFRGNFTAMAFTNWLWYRCVRPKLEETKEELREIDADDLEDLFSITDVEELLGEFMPKMKEKKKKDDKDDDKKKKKKGDKDDDDDGKKKKDKKDDKEKDKKGDKDKDKAKKKKKAKDAVTLKNPEKLQVKNLIDNMVFGMSGKNKTVVEGWVNFLDEKDVPTLTPWEFQIAHVMKMCMTVEHQAKKKKSEAASIEREYYESAQALADAIGFLKKQYMFEFPDQDPLSMLPLQDALNLQDRFKRGCGGVSFDLLWYLQNGAHLLAGSGFAKKHRSTVFKPFKIQELMVDSICKPGPQLVFGIAPPGTGKTAVAAHILNLFPAHTLVFCCAALPVVLGVGRIANSLGIPYAFVKGRRITPSFACGRGLGTHVDEPAEAGKPGQSAVYSLRYIVAKLNLERKKKRLALKKKQRNLHDLKRFPHIFMMCDTASCAWLARQLDPHRTIIIIDEPPMGSDVFPDAPEDNPIACAMAQAMMTPAYKTIWMSATLPRPSALPTLVDSFMNRFKIDPADREKHVHECFSTELDRGAVMCGPSGAVSFPHQRCSTAVELSKLCTRLPADPLVLKAYTERALASLISRWYDLKKVGKIKDGFKKRVVPPEKRFADLSELNHASIRAYALEVLGCVAAEEDDEFTKDFCEAKDEGEKNLFPAYNLHEMLFGNAYAFPGLTLVADDNPAQQLLDMSVRLQEQMPKASEIEDDIKAQEASAAKAEKFADDDEVIETATTKLKFSPALVIQSEEFLKKWCPARPANTHHIVRILPTVQEFLAIKDLPVDERWQMLALSGAGSFDPKLDSDPSNPVYTQWVHESMTRNKLACVTAGKEFTWGANVPASTVVVTKSFAETTSVAGMLQYVGRAARRGLTTHGQAIFERDEDLLRIFQSPDGLSTEARTMERYASWWLSRGEKW